VLQRAADVRAGESAAELLAIETGVGAPVGVEGGPAAALADCVRRALATAGLDGGKVAVVSASANGAADLDAAEREGLLSVLGDRDVRWLWVKRHVGECFSAAGGMQLAALLADPLFPGQTGLVTSVAWDGAVGAAVVQGRRS
jgi:3-oxoacyl-[acyl-carrier-protein] synthase II